MTTDVTERVRPAAEAEVSRPAAAPAPKPPKPRKPRKKLLAALAGPRPARRPVVHDARWWTGIGVFTAAILMLGFVLQVAVLSNGQHYRQQLIAYNDLRSSLANATTPNGQLDVNEDLVAPGTPVALMTAPSVQLSQVVVEGTSSQVLRSGPGHRRDSVMPGQPGTVIIMGRQATYGGPFGSLGQLKPGDEITFMTGQGPATYKVFGLRRIGDPMPAPIGPGEGRLELMTADGLALFSTDVLHVDAQLVSAPHDAASRVMSYKALPKAERAMGSDPGAWFIAFFIFVFMVAAGIGLWWLWTTWGRWHAWLIGVPTLLFLGVSVCDQVMNALPNLI